MKERFLKVLHPFGRRARVEQRAISKEKWIFFPSWTGSSFFAQNSTDWEPAAIEKRNPRIRSENSECRIARRQSCCCEDELKDRGGWRGRESISD